MHLTQVAAFGGPPFRQKLLPLAVGATPRASDAGVAEEAQGITRRAKPMDKKLKRENDGKPEICLQGEPRGVVDVALQPVIDDTIAGLPIPKMMSYQLADGETTTCSLCVLRID